MATREELEAIWRKLGVTENEALAATERSSRSGAPIYEKLHDAIVGKPLNGVHNAIERLLADWALVAHEEVDPSISPRDHLRHLADAAAIRVDLFLERHGKSRGGH